MFGESGNGASAVYDGEFLLFANDEVCNVRVGSRNGGGKAYQAFQTPGIFSFTSVRSALSPRPLCGAPLHHLAMVCGGGGGGCGGRAPLYSTRPDRPPRRAAPLRGAGGLLQGISLSRNGARELSEDIRKALRWGVTPVIVGFDPRFNNDRKLWFERPFAALRGDQSAFEADEYDWRRIDLEDLAAEDMPRER